MNLWENILLSFSGLRSSKMRSFLTMLGIIIGIGSVIGIVTVGNSLTNTITNTAEELGANQIYAYVISTESNSARQPQERDLMTDDMVAELLSVMGDDLQGALTSQSAGSGQAKDGRRFANVTLQGNNAGSLELNRLRLLRGRDITQREVQRGSKSAVVSSRLVEDMFPPNVDPLGQELKIHSPALGLQVFTIVGVYQYKAPAFAMAFMQEEEMPTDMYIPVSTAKELMQEPQGYSMLSLYFPPDRDSNAIQQKVNEFFDQKYRTNSQFGVFTQNMEGMMSQMTEMMDKVAIAISVIAAISLLVGGIGVMNIMLVSVTERTREIGTRKALGAKTSDIRVQFVIESMILCLIGGIIGIIVGLGLGSLGSKLLSVPASPSVPIIVLAVLFSMTIGVVFGVYPANKAAQLDPIEALRYE